MILIIFSVYLVGVPIAGLLYILQEVLCDKNKPSTYTRLDWFCFYAASLLSWASVTGMIVSLVYRFLVFVVKADLPALERLLIKVFG